MAIEKMMFVRATGPIEKLNEFNLKTLSVDYYHPENAIDYMPRTDGYHAVTEQSPFEQSIKHIKDIAKLTEMDIIENISNVFGTDRPISDAYIRTLERYVADNDFDSSDINTFLSGLKPKVDAYSARHSELTNREKYANQQIDKLSHFSALDVNPNEMLSTNYVEVHFGSLPKDSMIKLYIYNNDNKFIFNTYSSDDKYFWGVYCAAKQHAQEAEKVMSALYFDELKLDASDGSVTDIIEKYKKELAEIEKEQKEISDFWNQNKEELTNDLSILLDLQQLWSFRKYAVVKDDTFCCMGWIPKKTENDVRKMLGSVNEIEFTIKDPEKSVTATSGTQTSPFEQAIRDIEHLSHHVNYELTADKLDNRIGKNKPLTDEYIKKVRKYLGGADFNSDGNSFSGLHGDIHAISLKRKSLKARAKYLRKKVERLSHFKTLDVDLGELMSVSYSVVHFGRIPKEAAPIIQKESDDTGFMFNIYSSDDTNCWCIYCTPKKYAEPTAKLFNSVYFKEYKIDDEHGMISDIIDECKKELDEIDAEMQKIADYWHQNKDVIIECYSFLQDLQQLWNAGKSITQKNGKYIYTGSASSKDKKKILALYDAIGPIVQEHSDDGSYSETSLTPPTKLKNFGLAKPYEYYVKMYGMPNYGSIDITSFVAVTYTILFGIMFGDFGQGLVLFLGALFLWKKKKTELARIIIPCGVSSMFFGLIFGSFFGYEDLLDPLYHAVGMKGKPLPVMENINTVLLFAIGIGIALVAVSILINIYANIKAKRFGEALFDNNGLVGLIFYMCGVNLASNMMKGPHPIPTGICLVILAVCAVLLFMKELLIGIVDKQKDRKPNGIADFVMQNFFELVEYILSYFSNTVSFLRVGAFVLVHAGMMMVVFSLAGESRNIFVIILGNILIIALEGLLTGIQALRLEFYEMFSRCFEGSGKPFVSARDILAEQNKQI